MSEPHPGLSVVGIIHDMSLISVCETLTACKLASFLVIV